MDGRICTQNAIDSSVQQNAQIKTQLYIDTDLIWILSPGLVYFIFIMVKN